MRWGTPVFSASGSCVPASLLPQSRGAVPGARGPDGCPSSAREPLWAPLRKPPSHPCSLAWEQGRGPGPGDARRGGPQTQQ